MTTRTSQAASDMNRNPNGKGGFGDNPQNIHKGPGWSKENTISYQYRKLMEMTSKELDEFEPETIAQKIALIRIREALKDKREGLDNTKEVTDRTEGKAPQSIDLTSGGEKIKTALVEFIDGSNTGKDKDTDTD